LRDSRDKLKGKFYENKFKILYDSGRKIKRMNKMMIWVRKKRRRYEINDE
jgi:hypothetical protein